MEYPKVVYAMQHRVTKKIYIGLTNNLKDRYKSHLSLLKHNKHSAKLMQEEYNKYGGEYDVFILDEVSCFNERHKEFEWMQYYKSKDNRYGYNSQDRGHTDLYKFVVKEGKPERMCDEGEQNEH